MSLAPMPLAAITTPGPSQPKVGRVVGRAGVGKSCTSRCNTMCDCSATDTLLQRYGLCEGMISVADAQRLEREQHASAENEQTGRACSASWPRSCGAFACAARPHPGHGRVICRFIADALSRWHSGGDMPDREVRLKMFENKAGA